MKQLIAVALAFVSVVAFAPGASAAKDPFKIEAEVIVEIEKPKKETKPIIIVPPPVENIVKAGDTLDIIAKTHQTTWQRLWQKNLHLTSPDVINVGDKLIIPKTSEVLAERPLPAPPPPAAAPAAPAAPTRAAVPGNGYSPGYCTWFVKSKRTDIGNFWGNADQWGSSAAAEGYTVNSKPAVGSIGVAVGYMHVVYVEAVNGAGTVNISEMNYEGFGVVSSRNAPISEFVYIH